MRAFFIVLCFISIFAYSTSGKRINLRFPNAVSSIQQDDEYSTLLDNVTVSIRGAVSDVLGSNVIVREGLSGAAAGAVQVLSLMWLRTIVSYQSNYDVGFFNAVQTLYSDGGIGRFYRGLSMALVQGPLSRFGQITANEIATAATAYLAEVPWYKSLNISPAALGSVLSGLWRVILMPIDTIKTIQQVKGSEGYQSLLDALKVGDVSVLYQGTITTWLGAMVGHYPWFYVYNMLDATLAKNGTVSMNFSVTENSSMWVFMLNSIVNSQLWNNKLFRNAFMGFLASTASDTISNVFRVLKTVKQTSSIGGGGVDPAVFKPNVIHMRQLQFQGQLPVAYTANKGSGSDNSYVSVIKKIVHESGVSGLFTRGLASRILSNGIQSILFTVVWKEIASLLASNRTNDIYSSGVNQTSSERK